MAREGDAFAGHLVLRLLEGLAHCSHVVATERVVRTGGFMTTGGDKLEVFISYSRRDSTAFADQLDRALQTFGFKTVLDRHQISGGEDWQRLLGALILSADTVIFIFSPSSAVSEICIWEIEEALRLHKRILPVVAQPLGTTKPPAGLQKLNYIHFYDEPSVPGSGFGDGIAKLVTALNSDLEWLREHSRLLELAERWELGGRKADRLLTGSAIAEVREWLKRQPKSAPEPTSLQLEFIAGSEERANEDADRRRIELAEREALASAAEAAARDQQQAARKAEAEAKRAEDALATVGIEQQRTAKIQRRLSRALGTGAIAVVFGLYAAWWMQYQTILREAVVLTSVAQKAIDEHQYDRAMRIALQGLPHPGSGWLTPGWDREQIHGLELKLVEAAEGSRLIYIKSHPDQVADAAFSPDGTTFVTACFDDVVRLWDVKSGALLFELRGHISDINGVTFSPDGSLLLTFSDDRAARTWNVKTGKELHKLSGHGADIKHGTFSLDGKLIATASADKLAIVWDAETGKEVARLAGHSEPVNYVRFFPDRSKLLTTSDDHVAHIWDIASQKAISTLQHEGRVWTGEISQDGGRIVTASIDAIVWDAKTGAALKRSNVHAGDVNYAIFNAGGSRVLSASDDRTAAVWEVDHDREVARYRHSGPVRYAEFSDDESVVVTASSDSTAKLWTLSGTEIARLAGHEGPLRVATISPDGSLVLTGGEDRTVRLWSARLLRGSFTKDALVAHACADKLMGAQEFTEGDASDPILKGLAGRNPCLRRGPLSAYYWSDVSGWLTRKITRWRAAP